DGAVDGGGQREVGEGAAGVGVLGGPADLPGDGGGRGPGVGAPGGAGAAGVAVGAGARGVGLGVGVPAGVEDGARPGAGDRVAAVTGVERQPGPGGQGDADDADHVVALPPAVDLGPVADGEE